MPKLVLPSIPPDVTTADFTRNACTNLYCRRWVKIRGIEPKLGNNELLSSSTIIVLGIIRQDMIVPLQERVITVHALPI